MKKSINFIILFLLVGVTASVLGFKVFFDLESNKIKPIETSTPTATNYSDSSGTDMEYLYNGIIEQDGWTIYKNDKFGLQFEYPKGLQFFEYPDETPYMLYIGFKVALAGDSFTVSVKDGSTEELKLSNGTIPKFREVKTINGIKWKVFDGGYCTKEELQASKCTSLDTMPYLTYSTFQNGYWYQVMATNPHDEDSVVFQHILNTFKVFPLK